MERIFKAILDEFEKAIKDADSNEHKDVDNREEKDQGYKPRNPLPDNVPVYPGATMFNNMRVSQTDGENTVMYMYSSPASANELIQFFEQEMLNLGIKVDYKASFAFRNEFVLATLDEEFNIGWLGEDHLDEDNIDPNTRERSYALILNHNRWDKSLTSKKEQHESKLAVTKEMNKHGDYLPMKAVPKDLPVYPNAVMINDGAGFRDWSWSYKTDVSANEIIEFYKNQLEGLGFEIRDQDIYTNEEAFRISTTDSIVSVEYIYNEGLDKKITPDTSGRSYQIGIKINEWYYR